MNIARQNLKDRLKTIAQRNHLSIRAFEETCNLGRGNVSNMAQDGSIGSDKLAKIIDTFPDVNLQWLLTGKGSMLKDNDIPGEVVYNPNIGIPYYDVDFYGGFSEVYDDQTVNPTCNVVIPGFKRASVWCNVTGHSMEPKINHGDIIALRECTIQDVQFGEIYAVVLDSIRTIKIIRRGSSPDTLLYVPINQPDYQEQEFPIDRIIRIFEVIGSISKFF